MTEVSNGPAPGPGSTGVRATGTPDSPGRFGPGATEEAVPHEAGPVRMEYAPDPDGEPDPGEIVWTWVPYRERDGRGKDRPVLVVAREEEGTLLAVQLTSRQRHGDRAWLAIGAGPWDRSGRDSWVGLGRVLRIHASGMRREACALDRERFDRVTLRLRETYGWR